MGTGLCPAQLLLALTEDAEGIVGLDVWSRCVTEHTEEVQEVLETQAVPGWGCGEDPADSLLEGVGLDKRALCEGHRCSPGHTLLTPYQEREEAGHSTRSMSSGSQERRISLLGPAWRAGGPPDLGKGQGWLPVSQFNPKAGLGAEKEDESILSKENKMGWLLENTFT